MKRSTVALVLFLTSMGCKQTSVPTGSGSEAVAVGAAQLPRQTTAQTATQTDSAEPPPTDEARPDECPERKPPTMIVRPEEGCGKDTECRSNVCGIYKDAPAVRGKCIDPPDGCSSRFIGRLLDVTTLQPVPGAELHVNRSYTKTGALVAVGETEQDGRFDFTSSEEVTDRSIMGLMMEASAPGYAPTTTHLMYHNRLTGKFPAANPRRDMWILPAAKLKEWNEMLARVAAPQQLPIGKRGATFVVARDPDGRPLAGATVESHRDEDLSKTVFYLQDDGSFGEGPTNASGIAILLLGGTQDFTVGKGKYARCGIKHLSPFVKDMIHVASCIPPVVPAEFQ